MNKNNKIILITAIIILAISIVLYSSRKNKNVEVTENCIELSNKKICTRESHPKGDFWGSKTTTDFIETDLKNREQKLIFSREGYAPSFLGTSVDNNKIYYYRSAYEGSGPGLVFMIDIPNAISNKIDINTYGKVSPNSRYYATSGNLSTGGGGEFCNAKTVHTNTLPASSLKLLNFDTGEITILKEDGDSIFFIEEWNNTSDTITYSEMKSLHKDDRDGCPEYTSKGTGEIKIK